MGTAPKKLVHRHLPGTPVLRHSQWIHWSQPRGPAVGGGSPQRHRCACVPCFLAGSEKHLVQGKAVYCDT